jgi:multimeric flavodoxin WrbA
MKIVAINGSPRAERGYTSLILTPFIQVMMDAGAGVGLFHIQNLNIKPCDCGQMYCWYNKPGECYHTDDMQILYPKLKEADILVLATPVYIPLTGKMQDLLNRLCPLIEPLLENHHGRTRAKLRKDVQIRKIVLVSTGGWWEKENFATVLHIIKELAENAGIEFAGALLRPHAFLMKREGKITKEGEAILYAAKRAGKELMKEGCINEDTLAMISQPLISEKELRNEYNMMLN